MTERLHTISLPDDHNQPDILALPVKTTFVLISIRIYFRSDKDHIDFRIGQINTVQFFTSSLKNTAKHETNCDEC